MEGFEEGRGAPDSQSGLGLLSMGVKWEVSVCSHYVLLRSFQHFILST